MTEQEAHARVWDIIAKVGVGMLTTRFDAGLRARPLEPRPDRDEGVIFFITDARSSCVSALVARSAAPDVMLSTPPEGTGIFCG